MATTAIVFLAKYVMHTYLSASFGREAVRESEFHYGTETVGSHGRVGVFGTRIILIIVLH